MASLGSLPFDIKFLVLKSLPDFDTLQALILTSKSFYQVYKSYDNAIRESVWPSEISSYKLEAYFIAAYHEFLRRQKSPAHEVFSILYTFSQCNSGKLKPEDFFGLRGPQAADMSKMMESHRHIRRVCDFFIHTELSSRSKDEAKRFPASLTERERIIHALYRLWMIMIVFTSRQTSGGVYEYAYLINNWMSARLFHSWSFWEVMEIKTLKDFCWRHLTAFMLEQRKIILPTTLRPPEWKDLAPNVFGFIMLAQFPHDIIRWFQTGINESTSTVAMEEFGKITTDMGQYAYPCSKASSYFVGYLNGEMECFLDAPPEELDKFKADPKPICKAGHKPFGFADKRNIWARSKDDVDVSMCIWDEERLERWGYVRPVFGKFAYRNKQNFADEKGRWKSGVFGDVWTEDMTPQVMDDERRVWWY